MNLSNRSAQGETKGSLRCSLNTQLSAANCTAGLAILCLRICATVVASMAVRRHNLSS